ncbi:MAG TPA: NAD(P)H-hydrate dehydratase [Candidatus Saccharimonadia bacterium]|nr:NAD(P)H-hydrate dehydratase [Candidatus Saccharimonadia bacterium]
MNIIDNTIARIALPKKDSHKGQNGKLLIIGGSELFHAASAWSLEVASRIVDMVFYSSIPENNELIREAKKNFWQGVIVPRGDIASYIDEADCILIGPGMTRTDDTKTLTDQLLAKYPKKKWVIDAGALQMADTSLFTNSMIITPHQQEYERVFGESVTQQNISINSMKHGNVTIVVKGVEDLVAQADRLVYVAGGNEGMTKGGTGDVLAALIASLYCLNGAFDSALAGSYINKKAGDALYKTVGPFFNATDLVTQLPKTMKEILAPAQ